MFDYQIETLKKIRSTSSRLAAFSDKELVRLYQDWSEETACAGWLDISCGGVLEFCIWATTSPCDRKRYE